MLSCIYIWCLSILTLIVVCLPRIIIASQYSYVVRSVTLHCCIWTTKHRHWSFWYFTSFYWYLLTLSSTKCDDDIHFYVIVTLLLLIWVGQYSKSINLKLLIIKLLYGCYNNMFKINGFIQRLLVYSLKMVTEKLNQNISLFW